jgi:hypothetical protein
MSDDEIRIDSLEAKEEFLQEFEQAWRENHYLLVRLRLGKQRTPRQGRALEVFCRELADLLNDHGLDMQTVLRPGIPVPWTQWAVKEYLFKPVLAAMTGASSTTQADRIQYSQVHEAIAARLGIRFGVEIPPWPQKRD